MKYIFKFPDIGEGITEGKIIEWYVDKGNIIQEGDPIVKMETDKVVTDIPSPRKGRIVSRFGNVGDLINVNDALVEIEIEGVHGEAAQELVAEQKAQPQNDKQVNHGNFGVVGTIEVAGDSAFLPSSNEGNHTVEQRKPKTKKALATPVARAMAKDLKLDINTIPGTGPAGRVTKKDIQYYFDSISKIHIGTAKEKAEDKSSEITSQPLTQIRKTIAKHMFLSKQNAPHMILFEEVELSELMQVRKRHKEQLAKEGIKLTLLPFIIKATALALKKHPLVNGRLDIEHDQILIPNSINICIAIDTPEGLVTPVISNTNNLPIVEIAKQIKKLSEMAKKRELTLDHFKGGTFTITNTGSFGGYSGVPIINYPQSAILGTGQVREKPVVRDGQIVVGNVMQLFLSVNHGLIDGGEGTRFMNTLIEYLVDPISLILY